MSVWLPFNYQKVWWCSWNFWMEIVLWNNEKEEKFYFAETRRDFVWLKWLWKWVEFKNAFNILVLVNSQSEIRKFVGIVWKTSWINLHIVCGKIVKERSFEM